MSLNNDQIREIVWKSANSIPFAYEDNEVFTWPNTREKVSLLAHRIMQIAVYHNANIRISPQSSSYQVMVSVESPGGANVAVDSTTSLDASLALACSRWIFKLHQANPAMFINDVKIKKEE